MRRRGGLIAVLLAAFLVVLLLGAVVTVLALRGDIYVDGITPKKVAGRLVEVGSFNSSGLVVRNVVGNVSIVKGEGGIRVLSNLPVNVSLEKGTLVVYCPEKRIATLFGIRERNVCNDYENGTVVVFVGEDLSNLSIKNSVGGLSVSLEGEEIYVENFVGTVRGTGEGYVLHNVVGKVFLRVSRRVSINNVVGDVTIDVPDGFNAKLIAKDVLGKVSNNASGENGTVTVEVFNGVGDVTVG